MAIQIKLFKNLVKVNVFQYQQQIESKIAVYWIVNPCSLIDLHRLFIQFV